MLTAGLTDTNTSHKSSFSQIIQTALLALTSLREEVRVVKVVKVVTPSNWIVLAKPEQ